MHVYYSFKFSILGIQWNMFDWFNSLMHLFITENIGTWLSILIPAPTLSSIRGDVDVRIFSSTTSLIPMTFSSTELQWCTSMTIPETWSCTTSKILFLDNKTKVYFPFPHYSFASLSYWPLTSIFYLSSWDPLVHNFHYLPCLHCHQCIPNLNSSKLFFSCQGAIGHHWRTLHDYFHSCHSAGHIKGIKRQLNFV